MTLSYKVSGEEDLEINLINLVFIVSMFLLPSLVAAQTAEPAPLVTDRPDQNDNPAEWFMSAGLSLRLPE